MKSILSYNSLAFGVNLSGYIFAARLIFFYETEILLPIALITLAIVCFTLFDMINDPIIGHFCDRNYKFTLSFFINCFNFLVFIIYYFWFFFKFSVFFVNKVILKTF